MWRYEYRVSQHAYRSSTIRYLLPPFYEKEEAQAVLSAYQSKTQVTAAYDPENPARSVLEPGVPRHVEESSDPTFFWTLTAYIYYEIVHPAEDRCCAPIPKSPRKSSRTCVTCMAAETLLKVSLPPIIQRNADGHKTCIQPSPDVRCPVFHPGLCRSWSRSRSASLWNGHIRARR